MRNVLWLAAMAALCGDVTASHVWPKPAYERETPGDALQVATLQQGFRFEMKGPGAGLDYLNDAVTRYTYIIFRNAASKKAEVAGEVVTSLVITVASASTQLGLETDEAYNLTIHAGASELDAQTVYGAIRGLETFSQLVSPELTIQPTNIQDKPRFQFRASMIDTSRHFYPVSVILEHLDIMAYSKFNVLHWHLVDDQSFPYESTTYPNMSQTGAYSPSHVYTQTDIKKIVAYAMQRGIRVIPEFDTPGHVYKGYMAIPGLLTQCYGTDGKPNGGTGPLDPTKESTYAFLTAFFKEIKGVFPDNFVHVGGDEVPFNCWQSNPDIQKWMAAKNMKSYAELEQYYELRLLDILKAQNTSYVIWEDIFDNGVKVLPDTVVDVWRAPSWQAVMGKVTAAGLHSVLSAPFYLNYISYGADWPNYYKIEPTDFTCPSGSKSCDKSLVKGIEACMWSEYVDATNFIPRTWPRAAAVGERAWSPAATTDIGDATSRLHTFRCTLLRRGISAEPASGPGFCPEEYKYSYQPPWQS